MEETLNISLPVATAVSGSDLPYVAEGLSGVPVLIRRRDRLGDDSPSVVVEICRGERVAVLGPNGSGKTTLLKSLLRPGVAYVPQIFPTDLELAAEEYVLLGRTPRLSAWKGPSAEDRAAVRRAMEQTDTLGLVGRRLSRLSGGEQQRLALALALATGSPILLLDEPVAHLDAVHRAAFFSVLSSLPATMTIVAVLHDLPPAHAQLFTRLIRL